MERVLSFTVFMFVPVRLLPSASFLVLIRFFLLQGTSWSCVVVADILMFAYLGVI